MVGTYIEKSCSYRSKGKPGLGLYPMIQLLTCLPSCRIIGCIAETITHSLKSRLPFFCKRFFESCHLSIKQEILPSPQRPLREGAVIIPLRVLDPCVSNPDASQLPDKCH